MNKLWIVLGILIMASCAGPADKKNKDILKDKNVLLIVVDDLSDGLACYGHPVVKTPNIDRLAGNGIKFNNAYCNHPMCGPSRASFLTGLTTENTGIIFNIQHTTELVKRHTTLPHLFKQNGYYTAGIGKIFHKTDTVFNDHKAWDRIEDFKPTVLGQQGEGRNLTNGALPWCNWKATEGEDIDQKDGQVTQTAIEIIKEDRDEPLFLAVGLHKPHDPFWAPKKYFDLYPLDECTPPAVPEGYKAPYNLTFPNNYYKEFLKFTETEKREFLRSYYACISFMDAQVGKLLKALDETGKAENTLIVFFSDHGYHLLEHDFLGKFTLFERSLRVPFIVSGNAVKEKGSTSNSFIELVDLYPTLSEIMDLKNTPDKLDGKSMLPILQEKDASIRDYVIATTNRGKDSHGKMIKNDEWRYIEWGKGTKGSELYDQLKDPTEYYNLAEEEAYKELVKEMKNLLYE